MSGARSLCRAGLVAGLASGPFFCALVLANTALSLDYLRGLAVRRRSPVPWPSGLACGPYGWAQIATFAITGLLVGVLAVALRGRVPAGRAGTLAVVLLGLLGAALVLAACPVDASMLTGGPPVTWNGWRTGSPS